MKKSNYLLLTYKTIGAYCLNNKYIGNKEKRCR